MKHNRATYVNHKCRCEVCTKANRLYHAKWQAGVIGQAPPSHGVNGYQNYKCRCKICRAAWSEYLADWKARSR